jgi:6-pyruvoyltetrahydropterin/6-carboxytetrahydropterin synthase
VSIRVDSCSVFAIVEGASFRKLLYNQTMFRLSREVRFAVNAVRDDQLLGKPSNSYAGFPTLTGLGHWFSLAVTLAGEIDPQTSYLRNIKEIDDVVRRRVVPLVEATIRRGRFATGACLLSDLFPLLRDAWPGTSLDALALHLSPFLVLSVRAEEFPMIRLSQKFEFSASHRLHNPELSAEANLAFFGKCNNPAGHGHNYELQVVIAGTPKENGTIVCLPDLERIVAGKVIDRFDHKNLNLEVPEFANLNPTVENIARIIFGLLKPSVANLASVTVWETPKTW